MGGGVLDAAGKALSEVKAVADLHGIRGAGGDSLPVGEGAVAAGDLNAYVLTEPPAELFSVVSFQSVSGSRVVASTRRVP